jgi:hypothetical protein
MPYCRARPERAAQASETTLNRAGRRHQHSQSICATLKRCVSSSARFQGSIRGSSGLSHFRSGLGLPGFEVEVAPQQPIRPGQQFLGRHPIAIRDDVLIARW